MDIGKSTGTAGAAPADERLSRRGWHTRAALPMLGWMVALVLLMGVHRFVPRAVWLLVHLVTLGVASNAIVVWSNHFTDAVLRTRRPDHRREVVELALLNAALVVLCVAIVAQWGTLVWLGAGLLVAMAGYAIVSLGAQARGSLPGRFAMTVRWYQAAAGCLVVGVCLGASMAVPYGRWADALLVGHLVFNVLGWIGLTVLGTLTSLWPTMLRAKAPDGVESGARRALPVLLAGLLIAGGAALVAPSSVIAWRLMGTVGLLLYLAGFLIQLRFVVQAWWGKRVTSFPVLSAGFAQLWLLGWLVWLVGQQAVSDAPAGLVLRTRGSVPCVVVGFLLQVVLGALSYLVPVVLGGGPALVRATTAVLERGAVARLVVVNLGLAIFLLPIPSLWKVTSSASVFLALAIFPVLLVAAWRVRRRGVGEAVAEPQGRGRLAVGASWGLAWTVLAAAVAVAADPASFRAMTHHSAAAQVAPTGHTTTATVTAQGMRFVPDHVSVPAGDRLVVRVQNRDAGQVHDLVLESGATSGRVAPGGTATMDAGVVGSSLQGWCSVAGHRQMGMVFHVTVTGRPGATTGAQQQPASTAPTLAPGAAWPAGFRARSAVLAPAASSIHRQTLQVRDTVVEVAPGVRQTLWTFNGTAPGPALRGHVGDRFEITLVNRGSMGHSVDFHAGDVAPDQPMRTIAPGQSLTYRFTARRAGVWMYHCSTAPMSLHIANGMYGAVVIDPPDLPKVDREFLLVQGEGYFGADQAGGPGSADAGKLRARQPDAVFFNGATNQYDHTPLQVRQGERVRFWVLDAGPDESLAFHVVGAQFSSVWSEGAWLLRDGATPGTGSTGRGGSQTLGLFPSQGGFVETTFPQPGHYSLVNHQMSLAELGAHGTVAVR